MKNIIIRYISLLLFILATNAWGAATAVPGKPFEYLANLSQTSNTPVLIRDANNNEVGTYLGLGENQTRVMLGLTGSVDGQEFSFVVGAEKNGFDSAGQVKILYKWIEGDALEELKNSACGTYSHFWWNAWEYHSYNSYYEPCYQALVTYIEATAPCAQNDVFLQGAISNQSYSVGGFFEKVLISEPGATVYRLGPAESYRLPYGIIMTSPPSLVGIDDNGECGVVSVGSSFYNDTIPLYPFDKLGNLYDTYTPPFRLMVQ